MSEDKQVLRAISWREVFPFTHIFRSFRVAIHPSKLILALVALICLYLGGRVLDGIYSPRHRGVPDEVVAYQHRMGNAAVTGNPEVAGHDPAAQLNERGKLGGDFGKYRWDRRMALETDYADKLVEHKIGVGGKPFTPEQARTAAESGSYLDLVKDEIKKQRDDALKQVDDAHNKKQIKDDEYQQARREIFTGSEVAWHDVKKVEGVGLWTLFMNYEIDQVNGVVSGVTANNWFGGLTNGETPGVFAAVYNFFCVAPRWAFGQHAVYFVLLGILFLLVWAIFGGAIARIAAVHVAREEKLSLRAALKFSSSKFLSFVFAPVIPFAIILVIGLIVAIGGLLLYIPFIGPIVVGILFFLALAAGFVMTLVAIGTFGGLNLLYPTIAVEGSDSFDAISRSFSYVYNRPWRMLWYTIVAIIYGAFTFLFVRLFIFLTLKFTQASVGFLVRTHADDGQFTWAAIYPGSSYWHLPYDVNGLSLSVGQQIAAFFVSLWVYIIISFLGAYLISYYFSSSTVIYYLMRREVDATEMDDVFVEQSDDEFAEPLAGGPVSAGGPVAVATVEKVVVVTPEPSMPVAPPPTTTEGQPPST